jgi:sugar phosphate isomerase/epimerase
MSTLHGRLDLCSINTATLGYQAPIGETIDAVARAGFGAICPWRRELEGEDAAAVGRRIREAGLAVSGYCRSSYLTAADEAARAASLEDNRRALDQAAAIDAACFVMVVGALPEGSRDIERAWAQVAEGTAELLDYAKSIGVRLALEPLHPMYAGDRACLNTLEQALDLAERIERAPAGAPRLGVAVDVYHVWWDPKLAEQVARAGAAGRIFGYHVCDWLVPTTDMLLDRGRMGDGVIDLPRIRAMVEAAGYTGAVEVEIFSAENWWKRPIAETLAACAERLQTVC